VGGARTALFNWLYARRHGGTLILRIEDTDAERSSTDMVTAILDGLRWLGLDWDEGPDVGGPHAPYFQTARRAGYLAAANALVARGEAYFCYCTPDELGARRTAAETAGRGWMYDRACRTLTADDIARREAAGAPRATRFSVPEGETRFTDLVHGEIAVPNATIEDFVLVRSDGTPTYQLSVVIDDVDMAITHVVRGDDHISNTPKQILIYQALRAPLPAFAHVPLILGPDRKRLSKRHGATSVGEYERAGYLPEAMVNFLALLGWSPGAGNQEVFGREELAARFTLEGISGGNAVFNPEKLDWFSQQHLLRMPAREIVRRVRGRLEAEGLWRPSFEAGDRDWIERVVDLVKSRARTLADVVTQLRPFVTREITRDTDAVAKHLSAPDLPPHFAAWRARAATVQPFAAAPLEAALRDVAEARRIKAGVLIHATRVAVTGQAVSPGLFDVLELLGRDVVLARLADVGSLLSPSEAAGTP
jgi:glutamyl-tRNA synthetase